MFSLNPFRRNRKPSDFSEEIAAHIEAEIERLRAEGLSEEEAHNRAHRTFGNVTKTQERFYESRHWLFWDNLWRDVRYSLHLLRKSQLHSHRDPDARHGYYGEHCGFQRLKCFVPAPLERAGRTECISR